MRMRDGSSDVCSSDLRRAGPGAAAARLPGLAVGRLRAGELARSLGALLRLRREALPALRPRDPGRAAGLQPPVPAGLRDRPARPRSEEHTSELQSLMRISYAVFCLKKKKTTKTNHTNSLLIR